LSVVDEIRDRVDKRLAELQPAVDEYRELVAIKNGLANAGKQTADVLEAPPAAPSTSPRSRTRARRGRSPGRRGATRADQAINIVGAKPGVTVNEIAATMGINQNYLYRLLPRMEREGRLRREGRGWALAAD
jgi:predicted Rossmann fold nucleotide-binding protein DprA/Smf involved in DNA uptake